MKDSWRNIGAGKAKYLSNVNFHKEIIIFDSETTGLRQDAKIIQFSGIHYKINDDYTLSELDTMDFYINPNMPLPEKIIEITGITDYMLKSAMDENQAAAKISRFLQSCPLWGAYNSPFDLRMIKQMSDRTGIICKEHDCIDILKMSRDCIPKTELESHKLSEVTSYLFPNNNIQFHSSIEDVKATAKCFEYFLQMYRNFEGEKDKEPVRVNYASFVENPKQKSQKRIKLNLSSGEYGDIFWDVVGKTWSCKVSTKAQKLFKEIDMEYVEQQVINRYGWRYRATDMETLSSNWEREKRKKKAC